MLTVTSLAVSGRNAAHPERNEVQLIRGGMQLIRGRQMRFV